MNDFKEQYKFTEQEWLSCLKVLHQLKDNPYENPDNKMFSGLITKISKRAKKLVNDSVKSEKKAQDLAVIQNSTISKNALNNISFYSANQEEQQTYTKLNFEKNCYSCNIQYKLAHSFYNRLCPVCAEVNYSHRFNQTDLSGRNVILTGGRVKIGFAAALKFLRANSNLTITTRFPAIALSQLQKQKDYEDWKDNLKIYGLDLRNLKEVYAFVEHFKSENDSLDILVNNAAQTIKYTDDYYLPIVESEQKILKELGNISFLKENITSVLDQKMISFGKANQLALNRFGNPIDDREKTSWNAVLSEIPLVELLEVNLINQISPYILIKELSPLMKYSKSKYKFVVNVTSSEGQFSYQNKTVYHPHTNMTKAALNMLTRTSAKEYLSSNILISAVDVGWVSTGATEKLRKKQFEAGYIPPLDSVDGAARIMHPIIEALEHGELLEGKLIKNYKIVDW